MTLDARATVGLPHQMLPAILPDLTRAAPSILAGWLNRNTAHVASVIMRATGSGCNERSGGVCETSGTKGRAPRVPLWVEHPEASAMLYEKPMSKGKDLGDFDTISQAEDALRPALASGKYTYAEISSVGLGWADGGWRFQYRLEHGQWLKFSPNQKDEPFDVGVKEYRYGARNRPPGYGTVPKGMVRVDPPVPGNPYTRHGIAVYERPLSEEETYQYELATYIPIDVVTEKMVEALGEYRKEYEQLVRKDGPNALRGIEDRAKLGGRAGFYTDVLPGDIRQRVADRLIGASRKNPRSIRRNPSSNEDDCHGEIVLDSEGRSYPVVYRVVAAPVDGSLVVTSNNPQTFEFQSEPPLSYPAEFQTRDLSEPAEKAKILKIASSMEPVRLLSKNLDPTLGAPVVWPHNGRFYVLGGNGRTIAFLRAPERNYDRYLTMARCKWDCFPSEPAPEGSRWLLVREVVGLTKQQAVELAAASQKSTAASESPLAEAVGLVRSLHLSVAKMPSFEFDRLITADNIDTFRDRNEAFYNYIVSKLDEAKASNVQNRNSEAARYMRAACIGFLPPAAQKPSLYDSPSMEDAITGAAPVILTTHSLAAKGRLYPDYDLWEAMAAAVPIFARMQDKNLSMKAVKREVDAARAQTVIAGTKRDIDLPPMAWALAMALHSAANTKKPETAISDLLSPYLELCKDPCYRPPEKTMFGGGLSDRCTRDQLPPIDLFLKSVEENDRFHGNLYEIVKGTPAPGKGRGLFGNPYRINRGSKDDAPTVRKLVDLADHVSSRETDLPLSWYDPITPESARRFQEMNSAFYRHAVAHLVNDDWRDAADAIRGALLNTFPRAALEKLEKAPQLVQRNAVLAAPVMATLHAAAKRGEIPAHLDPVRFLPDGPRMLLHKKLSREMMAEFQDYAEAAYREDPRQYRLFALGNPTRVQSILFGRERWTALDARNWLRSHGYHGLELDRKANTIQFRQIEPEFFRRGTFRTIPFGDDGIQAVIGVPFGDPR